MLKQYHKNTSDKTVKESIEDFCKELCSGELNDKEVEDKDVETLFSIDNHKNDTGKSEVIFMNPKFVDENHKSYKVINYPVVVYDEDVTEENYESYLIEGEELSTG